MPPIPRNHVLTGFAAGVLLVTAALKLLGAAFGDVSQHYLDMPNWARTAMIEWELLLAMWLLSRWLPDLA